MRQNLILKIFFGFLLLSVLGTIVFVVSNNDTSMQLASLDGESVPDSIYVFDSKRKRRSLREVLKGNLAPETQKILVCLWAQWCVPCLRELPELQKHAEELSSAGIKVILINYDSGELKKVSLESQAWLISKGIDFENYVDFDSSLTGTLGLSSLPFSLLVDRSFVIKKTNLGELTDPIKFVLSE